MPTNSHRFKFQTAIMVVYLSPLAGRGREQLASGRGGLPTDSDSRRAPSPGDFASLRLRPLPASGARLNSIIRETRLRDLGASTRVLSGTSRLLKIRGRRECRALDAPAASHAK